TFSSVHDIYVILQRMHSPVSLSSPPSFYLSSSVSFLFSFFFFNDPATTEFYTLSLHDALPICGVLRGFDLSRRNPNDWFDANGRSEEHTSELQSRGHLVCRLLLEKKKRLRGAAGVLLAFLNVIRAVGRLQHAAFAAWGDVVPVE